MSNDVALKPLSFDWINIKDCAEHVSPAELVHVFRMIADASRKGFFVIVPLIGETGDYLREEDRADVTHKIRWGLEQWAKFLSINAPGFLLSASYHVPKLKPASEKVPFSCGFFTLKRIR
jgi:hypothetical protein